MTNSAVCSVWSPSSGHGSQRTYRAVLAGGYLTAVYKWWGWLQPLNRSVCGWSGRAVNDTTVELHDMQSDNKNRWVALWQQRSTARRLPWQKVGSTLRIFIAMKVRGSPWHRQVMRRSSKGRSRAWTLPWLRSAVRCPSWCRPRAHEGSISRRSSKGRSRHEPYLDYDRQCVVLQYVGQGQRALTPHEGSISRHSTEEGSRAWTLPWLRSQCVVLQYVGQGQRAFTPHEGGLSGGRKWRPVRVHVRTAGAAPSPSGHQVVLSAGHLHVQTGKRYNRTKSRYSIPGRVGMWCSRWNPIAVGDTHCMVPG